MKLKSSSGVKQRQDRFKGRKIEVTELYKYSECIIKSALIVWNTMLSSSAVVRAACSLRTFVEALKETTQHVIRFCHT